MNVGKMGACNALNFAHSIVPTGTFSKEDATEWCKFLNFVTNTDAYQPKQTDDPEFWYVDHDLSEYVEAATN